MPGRYYRRLLLTVRSISSIKRVFFTLMMMILGRYSSDIVWKCWTIKSLPNNNYLQIFFLHYIQKYVSNSEISGNLWMLEIIYSYKKLHIFHISGRERINEITLWVFGMCVKNDGIPRAIVTQIEWLNIEEKVKTWHFSLITESIQESCTWRSFGKNRSIIVMLRCRLKWQQLCAARDFLVTMFPALQGP